MKQIMLVETNLATAGHDVFHVYTAKDEADSEFIADMVVMVLGKKDEDPVYMDMMSGITAVIDENIYALGGEV